eukprot:TRINITY_DN17476_c0_g1_i1.p1 TRINITY_DN17476_c0_g1~~TRINITY_DN17476_c0_g1_i1.p1  ORF type:complete len:252 (+),score=4.04 TRINITY_DN17476_c0_g1_i1:176-931(+)
MATSTTRAVTHLSAFTIGSANGSRLGAAQLRPAKIAAGNSLIRHQRVAVSGRQVPVSRRSSHVPWSSPKDEAQSSGAAVAAGERSASASSGRADPKEEAEEVTKKWGLEAGLWKALTAKGSASDGPAETTAASPSSPPSTAGSGRGAGKSNTEIAKDLLTRYGGAYLATSISLSLVSFGLCYALVDQGVDVAALLDSVGLHVDSTGETVGTFAIAYTAHKALSPVRFPPTVALTPVVAGWFGKKAEGEGEK